MLVNNESYEDYLKAIYSISKQNKGGLVSNSEISKFLSITPASISGMLHKLTSNGYIKWKPKSSIRLTQKGKNIAKHMIENYKNFRESLSPILEKFRNKGLIEVLNKRISPKIQ